MGNPINTAPKAPDHTGRPERTKCCGKCAFRAGSAETEDGYGWAHTVEGFQMGNPFFCHETVPGHYQEDLSAGDRWQLCGGWAAHRKTGFHNAMKPAFATLRMARSAIEGAR